MLTNIDNLAVILQANCAQMENTFTCKSHVVRSTCSNVLQEVPQGLKFVNLNTLNVLPCRALPKINVNNVTVVC